jgi:hypothetical protein
VNCCKSRPCDQRFLARALAARINLETFRRRAMASPVWRPCLKAFLFPFGTVRRASDIGRSASPAPGTSSCSAFGLRSVGSGAAKIALKASGNSVGQRRILSPAESVNTLTVGGLHGDSHPPGPLPASTFDVWANTGLCNVSNALGPGYAGATKPVIREIKERHQVAARRCQGIGGARCPDRSRWCMDARPGL